MRILLILCAFCFAGLSFGQRTQDVVYLQNGSIIRGDVIEHIPGKHIKIETSDHSIWVFESAQVDSIKVERSIGKTYILKDKGYYNATSVGVLAGRTNWGTTYAFSLNTVNGYKINQKWGFGLGTGIEVVNGSSYFPMHAEARYDFQFKGFTPYAVAYGGYAVPINNNKDWWGRSNKGGFMGGAEIGIKNQIGNHTAITFGIGYRYMRLKNVWNDPWGWPEGSVQEQITDVRRISFKFGFLFN